MIPVKAEIGTIPSASVSNQNFSAPLLLSVTVGGEASGGGFEVHNSQGDYKSGTTPTFAAARQEVIRYTGDPVNFPTRFLKNSDIFMYAYYDVEAGDFQEYALQKMKYQWQVNAETNLVITWAEIFHPGDSSDGPPDRSGTPVVKVLSWTNTTGATNSPRYTIDPLNYTNSDGSRQTNTGWYEVVSLPVDIKVHQTQNGPQGSAPKYNNAPKDYMASNLFSVWPNEEAIVKVKLPPPFDQQASLPPNLIKWEVPGHNIADNTLEATLSWPLSFGGNLKEVKITIGGSLYKVHIKVQGVGIISEVEAAMLVPNASPIMLAYKSESETYAHSTYGITPKADAIRHGYWCSLSVSTFPVTAGDVDIISTAHEYRNRYSDNQQAFNSTMDLQNNAVGMTVNHQVNGLPDRTAIKSELEQRYSSGEMYIWEVPQGAASQSQRDSEGILIKSNKTRIY